MTVTGDQIVAEAEKFLGDPYVYGASGPSTFDCSGLVQYVYAQLGLKVPRVSSEQFTAGTSVTHDQLQPGDLVFSEWPGDDVPAHGHVAIYVGNGQIIEAPHPGGNVQKVSLDSNYLAHVDGYTRPSGLTAAAGGSTATSTTSGTTATDASWYNPASWFSGLLTIPGAIVDFFGEGYESLVSTFNFFAKFFQISTYIRIAAGFFGLIFLGFGLHFIIQEARDA